MTARARTFLASLPYFGFVCEWTPLEVWVIARLAELDSVCGLPLPETLFPSLPLRERLSLEHRRRRLALEIAQVMRVNHADDVRALCCCVLRGFAALGKGDPTLASLLPTADGDPDDRGFEQAHREDLLEAALRAAALRLRSSDSLARPRAFGPAERRACQAVQAALENLTEVEAEALARVTRSRTVLGAFPLKLPVIGARANLANLLLQRAREGRDAPACVRALLALQRCHVHPGVSHDDLTSVLESALTLRGVSAELLAEVRKALYGELPPGAAPSWLPQPEKGPPVPWKVEGQVVCFSGEKVRLTNGELALFHAICAHDGPTLDLVAADLNKTKETVCRNKNRLRAKLNQIGLTIRGGRVRRPRLHISDC